MLRFVKRELFCEVLQTNEMLLLLTLQTLQTFLDSMYEKFKKNKQHHNNSSNLYYLLNTVIIRNEFIQIVHLIQH